MSEITIQDRTTLRRFLEERFSLSELKIMAFDVGLDYEMFPHGTKPELVRSVITHLERRGELRGLVQRALEEIPDDGLVQILAKLPDKEGMQKVQIILSNDQIKSKPDLRQKLAALLGISQEEVMLIATAAGSVKVLVGLPPEAVTKLEQLDLPYQMEEYEIVEVKKFSILPKPLQRFWRGVVTEAITRSAGVAGTIAGGAAAAGSGLTVGKVVVWIIALILGALLLIGGGVAIWYQGLPDLTIVNNCGTTLSLATVPRPVRNVLRLPDEFGHNESIEFALLSGRGVYRLDVAGQPPQVVLTLPNELPGMNSSRVPLGPAATSEQFSFDGEMVKFPYETTLRRNQQAELVLCAGR